MKVLTIRNGNVNTHVVFIPIIPKYRRKALYGSLRKHLGSLFRELARHKECEIGEGHLMVDHVHILISIPPKYSVSHGNNFACQEHER
jgi:putative transposase